MPDADTEIFTAPTEFDHLGSLITVKDTDRCLGYLMHFESRGVYEPDLGLLQIDPQYVDPHNAALTKALIDGLDDNCAVGQGGSFYLKYANKQRTKAEIRTFDGALVAPKADVRFVRRGPGLPRLVQFARKGKMFEGVEDPEQDLFHFQRVF